MVIVIYVYSYQDAKLMICLFSTKDAMPKTTYIMTVLTSMMTIYKQQWRNERHSAIVACQTVLQSVLLSVFMCQVSLRSAEITSEFLEDGLLCRSVTLEVVTLLHLFERCLLLLCQSLWNIHADVYHEVSGAMSVALYRR